ncbi:MAG: tyrosine-type recombinase/integrase [Akkermansia sp.]
MSQNQATLAEQLLQRTSLHPDDAARLILELLETTGKVDHGDRSETLDHCRRIIRHGADHHAKEQKTLPFYRAVQELIRAKIDRRERTIREIQQLSNRIMLQFPHVEQRPLRQFTREECLDIIEKSFSTPCMQHKAVRVLHGLFNFGIKRGLCDSNPFHLIDIPKQPEARIHILTITQIRKLLKTAQTEEHLPCAPALGIMLWAGIRPNEIERLTWANIRIKDRLIEVEPQHSKTGGARHVHMQAILIKWLRKVCTYTPSSARIIPKAWTKRWKSLRQAAGFKSWQADTLRHTYASYHLYHFKDLNALQLEMGHSSTTLLRTRYLSMAGLNDQAAKQFWGIKKKAAR